VTHAAALVDILRGSAVFELVKAVYELVKEASEIVARDVGQQARVWPSR
jgi:hypothetical protein